MALLNSKKFEGLSGYGMSNQAARPQTFKKVFITGEPRDGQKVGNMQCMHNFDEGIYLIQNAESFYFIPMFIKQCRECYDDPRKKNPKLIYFSFNPREDSDFPEGSKCFYIFAGAAFTMDKKPYPRKDEPSKAALVYFKLDGIKMGGAIDYLKDISSTTSKLQPISDDPEFEKVVVSWRRFMVKVTVGTAKTDFGNKYVFVLKPEFQIPDEKVVSFMEQSETLRTPFNEQFDLTNYVIRNKRGFGSMKQNVSQVSSETVNEQKLTQEQVSAGNELKDIDLGI